MKTNDYISIITNLYIYITLLYSFILIIDELYNLGLFTFKYTYNYNYGTSTQDFNTIQTIECETNRFNIYSNIKFLKNDIFNKTYFTNIINIIITLITILCCLSYGVYFYNKFINENPVCSVDPEDIYISFPKRILKCICNDCHKIIPNCSSHNIMLFIITIYFPLCYILKYLFNYDFTPSNYIYIFIFIVFLISYIYTIINDDRSDNVTKDLVIFILFTFIFMCSGYIFKNIDSKYNNINLNTNYDEHIIFDIYKQSIPTKPSPVPKPTYNGEQLLNTFKYDANSKDINYKIKKDIMDTYYANLKQYDNDIAIYNKKNNVYKSTVSPNMENNINNYINQLFIRIINMFGFNVDLSKKLDDKINFFDISINILGLNNTMTIFLIILLIISYILYYIYIDDNIFICVIYLISILIIITLLNAILYYNTYVNKYIIYEPLSYYKNDITKANTKFNLYLNPTNGNGFYNKLVNDNNDTYDTLENKSKKDILNSINTLTNINNYNFDSVDALNTAITNDFTAIYINNDNAIDSILYYRHNISSSSPIIEHLSILNTSPPILAPPPNPIIPINPLQYLFENIVRFSILPSSIPNTYPIINSFKFHYSNIDIQISIDFNLYYKYIYNLAYQYLCIINRLLYFNDNNFPNIIYFKMKFNNILNIYNDFKDPINDISNKNNINNDINEKITNALNKITDATKITTITNLMNNFENTYIYSIGQLYLQLLKGNFGGPFILSIMKIDLSKNNIMDTVKLIEFIYDIKNNKIITYPNILPPNITNNNIIYYEYPNKITDNNNNEYSFNCTTDKILFDAIKLTLNSNQIMPLYLLFQSNDKNDNSMLNTITIKNISNTNIYINDTSVSTINIPVSTSTNVKYIYIPSKIFINDTTSRSSFKKIMLAVLYNDLCNITTKFAYLNMQKLLAYTDSDTNITNKPKDVSLIQNSLLNTVYTYKYSNKYKKIDLLNPISITDNYLNISSSILNTTDFINYIVLLYNTYNTRTIKDLTSILEYILYNRTEDLANINIDSFFINDLNLNTNLTSIQTTIDKTNVTNDLIDYYNRNSYMVSLIFKLYYNMINYIRTEVSKIDTENLCFSTTNQYILEQNLYNHINFYFINPSSNTNSTQPSNLTLINLTSLDNFKQTKIIKIGQHITQFFNIILYILNNLNSSNQTLEIEKEIILNNYKFYNPDIYNINDFVIKQLTINCNYSNKYNNMDTSQKELFKKNCDNVAYNFPILMIVIFIVLGQTSFIKS